MGRFGVAVTIALVCGTASANGRFPASRSIDVRGERWLLSTTFGLLVSSDGGRTVDWVCEDALGYSGTYDPNYAIASDGSAWLTTFDGIRVSRDGGCEWTSIGAPFDSLFPNDLTSDSSGRLWAVTAQAGAANGVFRNDSASDDGFARLGLNADEALFTSVAVGSAGRAYVAGFTLAGGVPEPLLYRTTDDGDTWEPLPTAGFDLGSQPRFDVRAVDPQNPDVVLLSIGRSASAGGDSLYRSQDGGQSFVEVLATGASIEAVMFRSGGEVVVGLGMDGLRMSSDGGRSFDVRADSPQLVCVTEVSGELLGCGTINEPDEFVLGRSDDGVSWTRALQFSDIRGPLECPSGTTQREVCAGELWPGLLEQLQALDPDEPTEGTCGCGAHPSQPLPAALGVVTWLLWRRRRREPG